MCRRAGGGAAPPRPGEGHRGGRGPRARRRPWQRLPHFRTEAALREAVTERQLDRTSEALCGIAADEDRDPGSRLCDWLAALFAAERRKAGDDPAPFATYRVPAAELTGRSARIVAAGVASGAFVGAEPAATARALFRTTGRFHDPAYVQEWEIPGADADFEAAVDLLVRGLRP